MTDFKEALCRFCFTNVTDNAFQVIDGSIRDILDVLLQKSKLYGKNKEVICNACRRKLNAALEFKSICLNTDNTIIPHVDFEKMLQLDLREIYAKENGSGHVTGINYNHEICRLCMQLIKREIIPIGEKELEAINKFVPEMNINIIKDPVICKPCFDFLCNHNAFLTECLNVYQTFGDIFDSLAAENQTDTSDLYIKAENIDEENEINQNMTIKTECVDIKSEEDEQESETLLLCFNSDTFENSDCKDAEESIEHNKLIDKWGTITEEKDSFTFRQFTSDSPLYKCVKCAYETKQQELFTSHSLKHKDPLRVPTYRCDVCHYESIDRDLIFKHQLKHVLSSDVQKYRCLECDYKTKQKATLKRHVLLKHKDPSPLQTHKCDACGFKTIYKHNFINYQLLHKDPLNTHVYRCKECDYVTKQKGFFTKHVLKHDPSRMRMYSCDACPYESRYKNNCIKHQLTHKQQIYRCNECDYETKYKYKLAYHVIQHKDPSQIKIYKCEACNFESRYKESLTSRQLIHKDSSEVKMYECNDCDYVTKSSFRLKSHAVKHKDPSQMQMFKCDSCMFETKYKNSLKCHEWNHDT